MATSLDEITGGVPRAPHPPDIEDVLGPPPHPPRIGRHGSIGAPIGRGRRTRPPSPPHLAKPSPPPQQAPQRQTIIQEVKPQPYKPPVATRENTPPDAQPQQPAPRGMGRPGYRARREAREQHARDAREQGRAWRQRAGQQPAEPAEGEGMSPEVRAKRAQGYADMKGTLDALRQPPQQNPQQPPATPPEATP